MSVIKKRRKVVVTKTMRWHVYRLVFADESMKMVTVINRENSQLHNVQRQKPCKYLLKIPDKFSIAFTFIIYERSIAFRYLYMLHLMITVRSQVHRHLLITLYRLINFCYYVNIYWAGNSEGFSCILCYLIACGMYMEFGTCLSQPEDASLCGNRWWI